MTNSEELAKPTCDPKAVEDIQELEKKGAQVEWKEFDTYLSYMIYCEGCAVQTEVAMSPHIVDTCIMYAEFCRSVAASNAVDGATAGEGKALDIAFAGLMRGKSSCRLQDCKRALKTSEIEVLRFISDWRRTSHFVFANAFAQYYILTEEWQSVKGLRIQVGDESMSVQYAIAQHATKLIAQSEVVWKTEVPKIRRQRLNGALFKSMCEIVRPSILYFEGVATKYAAVWQQVPTAGRLLKRMCLDCEESLREVFSGALARVSSQHTLLDFVESDPSSEFAIVLGKLSSSLAASVPPAQVQDEQATGGAEIVGVAPSPAQESLSAEAPPLVSEESGAQVAGSSASDAVGGIAFL